MNDAYVANIVDDSYRSKSIADFVADLKFNPSRWGVDPGLPGIIFVYTRDHAAKLAAAISERLGAPIAAVSSQMPKKARQALADRMRALDPAVPAVVSTSVWSTGINIPPIGWGLWAGGMQAPIWVKQSLARADRLADGKTGFVFFDWQDPGYEHHAAARKAHYKALGLEIKPVAHVANGQCSSTERAGHDSTSTRYRDLVDLSAQDDATILEMLLDATGEEPPACLLPETTVADNANALGWLITGVFAIISIIGMAGSLLAHCLK